MLDEEARRGAQKQWNARACGELPGDKQSVAYFDAVARDRYQQQPWMHEYFRYERFAGKHVLEIGIGQGTDMMQFAQVGAICHGVDITENHLKLTALNATLRGVEVDLHEADATRLPFADNSIDCVYSFGVLHHIPEIDQVVREIHRVLKPGGQVMIALYYKWSAFHLFWKLLANGLRNGWLFTKGYAGLLATIEEGADGVKVKPYVRLYSKATVRSLMKAFRTADVSVHQPHEGHFWPAVLGRMVRRRLHWLEPRMGWYVTYQGFKPSAATGNSGGNT
ncbi:class I SAM-dependent methyltransferase [Hydrogenophaga intermedia]|uniref:class I SAM-dependent methyltransferase n=1 Tax=Hydrogenophaga intermedia TaxID=65786 RepID=UPI002042EC12|nr:class I SAM-dependent methyltransferase [Hydrogenophaga intermedia]MCM3563621.1 class I SAM-dependent methyltransferase [Hydrogenophaga intermedia]